jgi:hypothetical protein
MLYTRPRPSVSTERRKKYYNWRFQYILYSCIDILRDRDSFESGYGTKLPVAIAAAVAKLSPLSPFIVLHFTLRENSGR